MTNEDTRDMCLSLLHADSEEGVIDVLKEKGFWDAQDSWRFFGDAEDNFSTIGNQQSRPEAALVEKLVNSVDAVLMKECWMRGLSPEDSRAPKTLHEAVAEYFSDGGENSEKFGHIGYWSVPKRTEVSRLITLAATGSRAASTLETSSAPAYPCFTISDAGEGQTPNSLPETILSLHKKNKMRIQFVQGKFNMGGTGVFRFCGAHKLGARNLQLVISRRNPTIAVTMASDDSAAMWGFTVIRREDPEPGQKISVYTYLAPLGSDRAGGQGGVLRFESPGLPIFPDGQNAYAREAEWGTAVKLYEYEAKGFRAHMLRKDGLLSRLDVLLPEVGLPVRLHECRDYLGHAGSFDTTLSGLSVRLEDDRAKNLEEGWPTTSPLVAGGERMTAKIYAFKKGKADTYRSNEGIVFTVNGQAHAHLPLSFFSRTRVRMGRLSDSILVAVDCSNLSTRAREDLFMNSRDRLSSGALRDEIERELEIMIREHQGLRALAERRKREEIDSKLQDSKPLEDILESILKSSPALSALFVTGTRLSNPFKTEGVASAGKKFKGRRFPTYFKFQGLGYGQKLKRNSAINVRCRLRFETDVVNDYFDRLDYRGVFTLHIVEGGMAREVRTYSLNLQDGIATLNIRLPENCSIGDTVEYKAEVTDDTRVEPFVNQFILEVGPEQKTGGGGKGGRAGPPSGERGHGRETPSSLGMPDIHRVYKTEWTKHEFDKKSATKIVQEAVAEGPNIYSFYVNMDNVFLETEIKASNENPEILRARFLYSMVLIGMALIQQHMRNEKEGSGNGSRGSSAENGAPRLEDRVSETTAAIAPVLLPMIKHLGGLEEDQVLAAGQYRDDE